MSDTTRAFPKRGVTRRESWSIQANTLHKKCRLSALADTVTCQEKTDTRIGAPPLRGCRFCLGNVTVDQYQSTVSQSRREGGDGEGGLTETRPDGENTMAWKGGNASLGLFLEKHAVHTLPDNHIEAQARYRQDEILRPRCSL